MLTKSVLSLEYVRVSVAARASGVTINPTGDSIVMAFTVPGVDPVSGDWKTASWETDTTTSPDTYYARCLVGPGGAIALAAGIYDCWIKISDSPEVPARRAGEMEIV